MTIQRTIVAFHEIAVVALAERAVVPLAESIFGHHWL